MFSFDTSSRVRRPSSKKIWILGVVVASVALVAVVSVLTGSPETSNVAPPALVGQRVKGFSLAGLDGGTVRAPYASGHASVLVFFASWCPPCRVEIPKIVAYLDSHSLAPVRVVAMDTNDQRGAARAFVRRDRLTVPVAFDANGSVASGVFGLANLPDTVFVNAQGVVTGVHIGPITVPEFAQGIQDLKAS